MAYRGWSGTSVRLRRAGRDDLVAGDEREPVAFLQRGVLCEPLRQLVAEGQVDDDPPKEASVGRDDLHLSHGGVRPGR